MFQLPSGCRVFAAIKPELQWSVNEIFANRMVYLLELLVWMKTKDAQKKFPREKPQPFVPEFMQATDTKDTEIHDADDIKDILSKPRV